MSDRLPEHYIRAYGLHAVYVASAGMPGASAAIVGRSRNLRGTLRWLGGAHGPRVRIIRHWWCASERDAQRVVNASQGEPATALEMCGILPNIVTELGLAMADSQVVQERALEAVEAVQEAHVYEGSRRTPAAESVVPFASAEARRCGAEDHAISRLLAPLLGRIALHDGSRGAVTGRPSKVGPVKARAP